MTDFEKVLKPAVTIVIDIETIPGEELPSDEDVKKADKRLKNQEAIDKKRFELWKKESLVSHKGRVLCIGYAVDNEEPRIITGDCQEDIIQRFALMLSKYSSVKFVGHYIQFDLIFLYQLALKYNVKNVFEHLNPSAKKTFVDTAKLAGGWIDYKYYLSLDNLSKMLGFASSKSEDIDGSKVFDYWQSGDLEPVYEYCKRDVALTRRIYNYINDLVPVE